MADNYTTTGQVPVGTILKVKENGVPVDYIVVNQGIPQNSPLYDKSCNGTWLLRKDVYTNVVWSYDKQNNYALSDINTRYLPNTILPLYDRDFQNVIKQVKIPYVNGTGNSPVASGANGLITKLFLLGECEFGYTEPQSNIPIDGAVLSYFQDIPNDDPKRLAYINGKIAYQWLRSNDKNSTDRAWYIYTAGDNGSWYTNISYGLRPAFILPTNLLIDPDNNILSQTFTITVPQVFMQGQSVPIEWSPWMSTTSGTVTYTIKRNTGSGWAQVATNLFATNYNDMAETGWTSIQYQITPVVDGINGPSIQSAVIPGVESAVLAISGIDQNLGTLTSNIPYTVVSNTGNPISLTRTVNGVQVVTLTVDSGFAYSIPVADLPTGTGTIQITASVEDTSQQIQTATRTWTYYKTPINIPSTGGIAQLTQNGQNIWPVTVPDAVEAPVYLGGNLNAALNKLGQAALYTAPGKPIYNQVTIDLSTVSVGDEINLPYNGVMTPHIVVQIGNPDDSIYDSSCDGVWLLNKYTFGNEYFQWNSTGVNTLAGSTIMDRLQGCLDNYPSSVSTQIKTVKIPYCVGGGSSTVNTGSNGLECQIFLLSGIEFNLTRDYLPTNDGSVLSYFQGTSNNADAKRIFYIYDNNNPSGTFTRSPVLINNSDVTNIDAFGNMSGYTNTKNYGYSAKAFILPSTFTATFYVDSNNNVHDSQSYTPGGSITDIFGYNIPISQFEVGEYTGTGTYGSSNPTSITTTSVPKFVCITNTTNPYIRAILPYGGYGFMFNANTTTSTAISAYGLNTTWSDTGVNWYNTTSQVYQLNENGVTYQYVIFS